MHQLLWLGLLGTLLVVSVPSQAHDVDGTSCQVRWRDGHVELTVQLNLMAFWERVENASFAAASHDGGGRAENGTNISPEQLRKVLESGIELLIDGDPIHWTLQGFPPPPHMTKMRADYATTHDDHIGFVTLRLQATEAKPAGINVGVTLPKELGDTIYTFVEPRSQTARAGAPTTFARTATGPTVATTWNKRDIFSAVALILSLAALVLHFRNKLSNAHTASGVRDR